MRVGAAESEARHTGDRVSAVARPVGGGFDHPQMYGVEVDIRIWSRIVDRRRNLVVVQGQRDLGKAGRAGGGLQVAHVRLDRAEQCGLLGLTAPAHHSAEGIGLDRVTQNRAGAMRLDVIHGARIHSGIAVGPTQYIGLGVGVGRKKSVGTAIMVDCATGDHGQDLVAVTAGVVEALEYQHARTFGAGISVCVGGERFDPAVRCQYATDLIEAQRHSRGHQGVHPARQNDIGLTGPKSLHAGVHRHQR